MAARMKELRYARKASWRNYSQLEDLALDKIKEKDDFPDRLDQKLLVIWERGVSNKTWLDFTRIYRKCSRRFAPSKTYEEHVFCVGCHSNLGRNN
jgi:hypothetical protein